VVRFVKRAQELGFSLDEVEELLHLAAGGPRSCDVARAVAETRVEDLEAKISDLVRTAQLRAALTPKEAASG
jgi:MerR family mercuric resistance operon transcriptional regulator